MNMGHHYSDNEIVDKIKSGDSNAFKYLVDEMLPAITYYTIRNGGNEEDAKDLFQDALFILIEKIRTTNFVLGSSLSTYLYAICKNIWTMTMEKRRAAQNYQKHIQDNLTDNETPEQFDSEFYEKIFMKSFQGMEEQCQTILRMYWTEIPPEKIASAMEFSYGYLRKRKSECMKELKRRIMVHPDFKELEVNLNIR
jgi:RNA polymerase sigma factor (sigma-70 family)